MRPVVPTQTLDARRYSELLKSVGLEPVVTLATYLGSHLIRWWIVCQPVFRLAYLRPFPVTR